MARRPGRLSGSRPGTFRPLWPATNVISIRPRSRPSWPSHGHHECGGQRASCSHLAEGGAAWSQPQDGSPALWSDEANAGAATPEQGPPPCAGHGPTGLSLVPSVLPAPVPDRRGSHPGQPGSHATPSSPRTRPTVTKAQTRCGGWGRLPVSRGPLGTCGRHSRIGRG